MSPAAATRSATARPMPFEAPVISTRLGDMKPSSVIVGNYKNAFEGRFNISILIWDMPFAHNGRNHDHPVATQVAGGRRGAGRIHGSESHARVVAARGES